MYQAKDVLCGRCQHCNPPMSRACEQCGAVFAQYLEQSQPSSFKLDRRTGLAIGLLIIGLILFYAVIYYSVSKRREPSSANKTTTASNTQPVLLDSVLRPENSASLYADYLAAAKRLSGPEATTFDLKTAETNLQGIPEQAPEHKEAKTLLPRISARLKALRQKEEAEEKAKIAREAPALRERLKENYQLAVSLANPHLNFIQAKVQKVKGGYALWAVHAFFTQSSFSIGDDAHLVRAWMESHSADLERAGIVRVGYKNESGYLGSCWFDVK